METSLHRELKSLYADAKARFEVRVGRYRIDVVSDGRLIEIQHGPLAAIRAKARRLLDDHELLIVKPIVVGRLLVKRSAKGGEVTGRRRSPKRGRLLDLFDELVHFTDVFPHPRLTLEAVLVEIEEWRYPGHGRRRRRRDNDHQVEDQRLLSIVRRHRLRTASELADLIPSGLPGTFHTGHLAEALGAPRWIAQRIAYCLRETGATRQVGRQGNTRLYQLARLGRPCRRTASVRRCVA